MSVDSFANIFSHSEGCLFVLFRVSFAVQKESSLSFFFSLLLCWGLQSGLGDDEGNVGYQGESEGGESFGSLLSSKVFSVPLGENGTGGQLYV